MKITFRTTLLASALLAAGVATSPAAIFEWVGDTTLDADWDTGTNWDEGTAPVGGANQFEINTGSSELFPVIYDNGATISFNQGNRLGEGVGDSGYLQIDDGEIVFNSQTTLIGQSGIGMLIINDGGVVTKNAGQLTLGANAGSTGTITVNTGGILNYEALNQNMIFGSGGDGVLNVHGGTVNMSASSTRQYNFGTAAGSGTGLIDIRGGTIQGSDVGRQTINIGYGGGAGTGRGTLQGYGTVSPIGATNDGLIQNGGMIIADGTDTGGGTADRNLTLRYTNYTTADNTAGMHFGLYTQNQGGLDLETVNFGGVGNTFWGDNSNTPGDWTPGSATTVQVNSAYLFVNAGSNNRIADISLLDPSRTTDIDGNPLLVNSTGDTFMNIWQVDAVDLDGEADVSISIFSVRYDESFSAFNSAAAVGDPTTLYYWDGVSGTWIDLSDDVTIDTVNYIAYWEADVNGPFTILEGDSGYFALASAVIPEPASASMLLGGGLLLLMRRKRRA